MKKRNLTAMAMAEETVSSSGSSTGSTTQADNNFAAKNDKTIHDTVELVESSEKDSNKKEIDSDIVAGDAGVIAEGDHSYGIMAFPSENGNSSANVHVTGSVTVDSEYGRGISAVGNGYIIVDKDVISSGTGVMAYDGMKVEIGGDVKSGSTNSGIYIDGGSSVTVHGNVSGYRGVIVDTTITNEIPDDVDGIIEVLSTGEKQAMVVIEGDLQSDAKQAIILSGSEGKVIVKGDVSAAKDTPVRIYADYNGKFGEKESEITAGNSEIAIGGTLLNKDAGAVLDVEIDEKGNALETPEIVIGEIEDISKLEIKGSYNGQEGYDFSKEPEISDEAKKAVLSSIKYIVNTSSIENGAISITKLDGSRLDRDRADLYDVAKASEEIKVQIVPVSGYSVKSVSGGKATVTQNSDGSYTVLVPAGGGVDISAILEKIEEQSSKTPAAVVKKTSSGGGSSSSYSSGSMHAVAVTAGAGKTSRMSTPGSWKQNADKSWSFVDSKGETYKNTWIVSNSRWYYADANGNAAIGWVQIDGVWYYFAASESSTDPLGSMLAGITTPDGYKLDSNGAWVK